MEQVSWCSLLAGGIQLRSKCRRPQRCEVVGKRTEGCVDGRRLQFACPA